MNNLADQDKTDEKPRSFLAVYDLFNFTFPVRRLISKRVVSKQLVVMIKIYPIFHPIHLKTEFR